MRTGRKESGEDWYEGRKKSVAVVVDRDLKTSSGGLNLGAWSWW